MNNIGSPYQKIPAFTPLQSAVDPGDHIEVSAWVPLTIGKLNPNFNCP